MARQLEFNQSRRFERQVGLAAPDSVDELLDVSLSTERAQDNPLGQISQEHTDNEQIQQLIIQLELRLDRYLQTTVETDQGTEIEPSAYARALFELFQLPSAKRTRDPRWAQIQEINHYIRPEITFLLQQLREVLGCSGQELLQRLRTNRIDGRSVATIFSYWQRLEPFELEAQEVPTRIVIMNPLDLEDAATQLYWDERGKYHHRVGRNGGLPTLIELKRVATLDVLEVTGEAIPAVAEACQVIRQWIEEDIGSIRADATKDAFGYYTATMDFMQLDPSTSIPLFIALGRLKEHCPTVYLRLVGIAPEGHCETGEAQRSDLFGSPVQLALYRLGQHADLPPELRTYAEQLMQMDVAQTPLAYIGDERFKQISGQLMIQSREHETMKSTGIAGVAESALSLAGVEKKPVKDESVSSAVLAAVMLIRPEVVRAYQLQQEMRAMMKAAERANIPEIGKRIRAGSRREIINILKKIPYSTFQSETIKKAMRTRVSEASFRGFYDTVIVNAPETRQNYFQTTLFWEIARRYQDRMYGELPGEEPLPGDLSLKTDLFTELWMTAPKEVVLSDELIDDVILQMNRPAMVIALSQILKAHAVTAEQWKDSPANTTIPNYYAEGPGPAHGLVPDFVEKRIFNYQQRNVIERKQKLIDALIQFFEVTPLELLWDKEVGPQLGAFYAGVDSRDLDKAVTAKLESDNLSIAHHFAELAGGYNSGVRLGYYQLQRRREVGGNFIGSPFNAESIMIEARLYEGLIDTETLMKADQVPEETMIAVSNMLTETERTQNIKTIEYRINNINRLDAGHYQSSQFPARDAMMRWVEILKSSTT